MKNNTQKRITSFHEIRPHLRELAREHLVTRKEYRRIREMSRSPLDDDRTLASMLVIELRRKQLVNLLNQCSDHNRDVFRRMYWYAAGGKDRDLQAPPTTEEIVQGVDLSKITWAIQQCKNTLGL